MNKKFIELIDDFKYIFAFTIPLSVYISINSDGIYTFTTLIYAFVCIPVLEIFLKTDDSNLSDIRKKEKKKNKLFDIFLYMNIPIVFSLLFIGLQNLKSNNYFNHEYLGIILSLGILLGTNGINVAHELGHRPSKFSRNLSKLLLMPSLYMHFFIEHNFGHHNNVGTPEDPATSKINQSVYSFWISSILYQYIDAWKIQKILLTNKNKSFFSIYNDMILYLIIQSFNC
jgi:alkane 1-monooxygenase